MNSNNVKYKFFFKSFLSNFCRTRFIDENQLEFFCTEQKFMYDKAILFKDYEIAKKILSSTDPWECKNLGREVRNFDQEVWDSHKYQIMYNANLLKYTQSDELRSKLLKYKGYELVEASPYDRVWRIGFSVEDAPNSDPKDWGENLLGKILTRLCNQLSN